MRLVHISDPHLLRLDGARLSDYASKRWIGRMNLLVNRGRHHRPEIFDALVDDLNQQGVDHLVVTGDITNIALPGEFEFARERFDRIALGPRDTTVIPGNHDAYVAEGAALFTRTFEPYHEPDPDWMWSDDRADRWPLVRVRGDVAIVGISTSLRTPWFTAYGEIGERQLDRLESALTDERLAERFRVVAIHHPPAGAPSESWVRGLRDRAAFAHVLGRAGAELVLHGHEHRDLVNHMTGPGGWAIPVRGITSGSYEAGDASRRARYRIYDIQRPAAGTRPRPVVTAEIVRIWDPESGRVVAHSDSPARAA